MRDGVRGAALLAGGTGLACGVVGGGVALAHRLPLVTGAYGAPLTETMFTAVIFLPLILIAAVGARLGGLRAVALGGDPGRSAAMGIAIGLAGVSAAVGDARLAGALVRGPGVGATAALLLWGAAVVFFQAGAEEAFFRGWLQPTLQRRWGALPAVLGASVAFAVAHIAGGDRAPLSLVNLVLGGVGFGLLALRTGGVAPALGMHFAWNAGEQLLYGLDPNPGIGSFGAVANLDLVGRAIWGGSGEGLNGSVAMTFVLAAILLPLLLLRRAPSAAPGRRAGVSSSDAPALRPSGPVP